MTEAQVNQLLKSANYLRGKALRKRCESLTSRSQEDRELNLRVADQWDSLADHYCQLLHEDACTKS